MALEVEVKHRFEDHAGLERRLASLGAKFVGTLFEINTFFDKPDGSLRAGDQGLRLRSETLTPPAGPPVRTLIVTHKGPRRHGPLKSREETEVRVDDAEKAVQLLEALGFVKTLAFEKERRRWDLDGCHVELDHLPILGRYVEIEGPGEAAVVAARARIGLGDLPEERKSYVTMLAEHVERNRLSTRYIGLTPSPQSRV